MLLSVVIVVISVLVPVVVSSLLVVGVATLMPEASRKRGDGDCDECDADGQGKAGWLMHAAEPQQQAFQLVARCRATNRNLTGSCGTVRPARGIPTARAVAIGRTRGARRQASSKRPNDPKGPKRC